MKTITLQIESCLDCPFHKIISDPDPNDWFCDDDKAVVCIKSKNNDQNLKSKYATDRQEFKPISVGNRPYQIKKELIKIPTWCPIPQLNRDMKINSLLK